jgi:hypothetical protein
MEPATDVERTAELRNLFLSNDLNDLRGREFLRLLGLAHNSGLLDALILRAVSQYRQALPQRLREEFLAHLGAPETQSKHRPFADLDRQPDAYKLRSEGSSSQSIALACCHSSFEITPEMIERGQFYLAALDPEYFGYSSRSLVETLMRVVLRLPLRCPDQIALELEAERLRLGLHPVPQTPS